MKLILTHYPKRHIPLLEELAKALEFKINLYPSEPLEAHKVIFAAMEESRKTSLISESARQDFENLLYNK